MLTGGRTQKLKVVKGIPGSRAALSLIALPVNYQPVVSFALPSIESDVRRTRFAVSAAIILNLLRDSAK
jgi:hypothetical protein